jgi:hypothetical protein
MITYMQYSCSMVMVLVNTIFLRLSTKGIGGAGTDGDVYLGIGGREFSRPYRPSTRIAGYYAL